MPNPDYRTDFDPIGVRIASNDILALFSDIAEHLVDNPSCKSANIV